MAYWGCSTFPNRFLAATVQIRKILSPISFEELSSVSNKATRSSSSIIINSTSSRESEEQIVTAISEFGHQTFLEQIFPQIAYSSVGMESGVSAVQDDVRLALSEIGIVSSADKVKDIVTISGTTFLLIENKPGFYSWKRFDEIQEDDNYSEI